ncbi:MAG: heat-inducible transcriptional repressor HrcA [Myxococcales bacterium]|nr:heat-inducible transcriptional repressor HrcA [Myxococcales bacterium]
MPGDLPFRNRKILYALVTEYVATGEPVGSRRLSKAYELNLSPASIRNVLADLEEGGYLMQPHPSAGRIPTHLGFRIFVDALMHVREVSEEDRQMISSRMASLDPGKDDVLRETGRLLSSMTGAAAVMMPPRAAEAALSQLRFMPLREGQLLAVLVTRSGAIQNRILRYAEPLEPGELERVNNYLEELLDGRSLAGIRDHLARLAASERGTYDRLREQARQMITALPDPVGLDDILIEGRGHLFDRPEFEDTEKLRGYLRAFEERAKIVALLDRTMEAGGVRVLIGAEAEIESVDDISLVASPLGARGGSLGLIGPTRMDYAKIVPLVSFTASVMGPLLGAEPDRGPDRR